MYFEDDESDVYVKGAPVVMVSSSMYGFEDQILMIKSYFHHLRYNVITSMDGTIFVDPRLGNFDNCLAAVSSCDLFFGVIRPFCGTGNSNESSITFQEFQRARELGKPSWYVIDKKITYFHDLFYALRLRQDCQNMKVKDAIDQWVADINRNGEKMPMVLDLFEPDRSKRYFDPECFVMEDFVNQRNVPKEEVTNNWMQYCNDILDVKRFIETNFADHKRISEIIKEA